MITFDYIDVHTLKELPDPPDDMRYFDFIGGDAEYRCFIVPKDTPRGSFMAEHPHLLDETLRPIYMHEGIMVCQDSSYAIPGFYIVSPTKHFRSIDEIDPITNMRLENVKRVVRKGMREELGIQHAHIYYEEKAGKSCNVHYWLLPINDIEKHPRLYDFDVHAYMEQESSFCLHGDKIRDYNVRMRAYVESAGLRELDNRLIKELPQLTEPKPAALVAPFNYAP